MIGNKKRRQSTPRSRSSNTNNANINKKSKNNYFKQKPLNEKLKNIHNDEEILSGSEDAMDDDNLENDEFFEVEEEDKNEIQKSTTKTENTDEKRLRLAKKLINQIGNDITKDENDKDIDIGVDDAEDVDEYLREQIKKEKHEFFLELASSPNFNPIETGFFKGHLSSITSVDISSTSTTALTCAKDCRAIKWDLDSGKKFLLPQFTNKALNSCIFTPDDNYGLFAGADKYIHQMDLRSEKIVQSFKGHNDSITGLIFDQNKDQFYSVSRDTTLKVWGVGTTKKSILLETFYGHTDRLNDVDIMSGYLKSENNDVVAKVNRILTCGNDFNINLWKIDTQSFLQYKSPDSLYQIDLVKSLNNEFFLSGSYDGMISLWKTNKKKPLFKLQNSHGYQKKKSLNHPFFNNVNSDDEGDAISLDNTSHSSGDSLNLPYPILSLACIKNSDLVFSGSSNGYLNIYKFNQTNNLNTGKFEKANADLVHIKNVPLKNKGCINAIKVNKTNQFLVIANGKDCRLGRWDTEPKAKNGISIVKLFD